MVETELLEVYSADNVPEAYLVKAALEAAGIEARVVGDHLQNAVGDLPAIAIAPRVWVHAENFDHARKIIDQQQARRQSTSGSAIGWKCAQCGEPNGPSFEICWQCQTACGDEAS